MELETQGQMLDSTDGISLCTNVLSSYVSETRPFKEVRLLPKKRGFLNMTHNCIWL